eukprot:9695950-Alexandrium_andersonii.AAC.1
MVRESFTGIQRVIDAPVQRTCLCVCSCQSSWPVAASGQSGGRLSSRSRLLRALQVSVRGTWSRGCLRLRLA